MEKYIHDNQLEHSPELTKGELMKKNYTVDELKQIDATLPISITTQLTELNLDPYFYVMNYNNSILGTLEKMDE